METMTAGSIAYILLVFGVLFAVRYLLAMRRIFQEVGKPAGFVAADYLKAPKAEAYGGEMEPSRRYAARQYFQAAICFGTGAVLLIWLLVTGAPVGMAG
ncbi:hypothetical protein [Aureimonas glaciei]|jgi:hypothetical protein|uniref:Uncharacterized protein n=1 Tax=Aureimonas glaciei TaxID=1776957 RepID=A0A917D9E0_9HYPH|nr:hypothetical protein [Aureimonas glaciei]GGD17990.1 hypothetical protein GCM10011335_21000 [Aureimonas glaciei]